MSDSVTPWTADRQVPLFMGFSRREYWRGLPFPPPGDLPDPETDPTSPALAGRFFTTALSQSGSPAMCGGCQVQSWHSQSFCQGVSDLVQEVLLQADVAMQIPAVAPQMCSAWRSRCGRGVCTAPWSPGERTGGHCPWRDTDFCSGPQPQSGFSKTAGQRDQPFRVDFVETLDVQQRGRQMKKQLRSRRQNRKAGSAAS